ncbi:hypothetical protein D2T31_00625 [Sinirhodobacter populi]|uniref:Uncharacterized protein n=1 Tax=Paenirhodobacter populi TaxID=2306993 RepID=A0A443KIB4_9RHOB|nr:hypothetical protein [Sinirhodobacter populi]RWR32522.1 hypothetical protein D2T31_00625 [Sinirhodobacter populi]
MSLGSALALTGTAVSAIGSISQGIAANKTAKMQAEAIRSQMTTEAQLTAVKDSRTRAQYRSQIAQQRAELAARGVSLDSSTAIMLGQTAAQEMSFDSQSVRSDGAARQQELSYSRAAALADGKNSLLKGIFSAAGSVLTGSQQLWPGLSSTKIGGAA